MNAARHRVTSWTLRKNTTHEQPDSVMIYPEWNVNGICQEPGVERTTQVTSLAQVLKDNGYHTIHCGKAHFGANDTPGADPLKMGFDVNIAGHAAGSPASYYGMQNFGNKPGGKARWLPYPDWKISRQRHIPLRSPYHRSRESFGQRPENGQAFLPLHGPLCHPYAYPARHAFLPKYLDKGLPR